MYICTKVCKLALPFHVFLILKLKDEKPKLLIIECKIPILSIRLHLLFRIKTRSISSASK